MATVCTKCNILVSTSTMLGFFFFLTRIYNFKLKLTASSALSILLSLSVDKTPLPLKETGLLLHTPSEAL